MAEIRAGRLRRVVDGPALAGVFSLAYEDGAIWGERERGAHVYLHRIARAIDVAPLQRPCADGATGGPPPAPHA